MQQKATSSPKWASVIRGHRARRSLVRNVSPPDVALERLAHGHGLLYAGLPCGLVWPGIYRCRCSHGRGRDRCRLWPLPVAFSRGLGGDLGALAGRFAMGTFCRMRLARSWLRSCWLFLRSNRRVQEQEQTDRQAEPSGGRAAGGTPLAAQGVAAARLGHAKRAASGSRCSAKTLAVPVLVGPTMGCPPDIVHRLLLAAAGRTGPAGGDPDRGNWKGTQGKQGAFCSMAQENTVKDNPPSVST
jgi:hypothetical protein